MLSGVCAERLSESLPAAIEVHSAHDRSGDADPARVKVRTVLKVDSGHQSLADQHYKPHDQSRALHSCSGLVLSIPVLHALPACSLGGILNPKTP